MWALRLKAINTYLPILDLRNNNVSLDEAELVKIITRNMPGAWNPRFKLVSGHKSATVTDEMKVNNYIEK